MATKALRKFVLDTEKLYSKEFMRFNVHCLLHLARFVKLFGALWAWSAFPFEHFNGVIKKLFFGTQQISAQILKQYKRYQYIKSNSHIFSKESCNKEAKKTFIRLMRQVKVKNCIEYDNCLKIFGKEKNMFFS